jgi:uncharacterized membrane protein YgcG
MPHRRGMAPRLRPAPAADVRGRDREPRARRHADRHTYPLILPDTVPPAALSGTAGWVITTREARLVNAYVRTLDTVIGHAVAGAAGNAARQGRHVDTVDLRDAFARNLLFSRQPAVRGLLSLSDGQFVLDSFHPDDLGQRIIGQRLQPVRDRAVALATTAKPTRAAPARPGTPRRPARGEDGEGSGDGDGGGDGGEDGGGDGGGDGGDGAD